MTGDIRKTLPSSIMAINIYQDYSLPGLRRWAGGGKPEQRGLSGPSLAEGPSQPGWLQGLSSLSLCFTTLASFPLQVCEGSFLMAPRERLLNLIIIFFPLNTKVNFPQSGSFHWEEKGMWVTDKSFQGGKADPASNKQEERCIQFRGLR